MRRRTVLVVGVLPALSGCFSLPDGHQGASSSGNRGGKLDAWRVTDLPDGVEVTNISETRINQTELLWELVLNAKRTGKASEQLSPDEKARVEAALEGVPYHAGEEAIGWYIRIGNTTIRIRLLHFT